MKSTVRFGSLVKYFDSNVGFNLNLLLTFNNAQYFISFNLFGLVGYSDPGFPAWGS